MGGSSSRELPHLCSKWCSGGFHDRYPFYITFIGLLSCISCLLGSVLSAACSCGTPPEHIIRQGNRSVGLDNVLCARRFSVFVAFLLSPWIYSGETAYLVPILTGRYFIVRRSVIVQYSSVNHYCVAETISDEMFGYCRGFRSWCAVYHD